jgi:hypothetical protein
MAKAKVATDNRLHFWCPGCDEAHGIRYRHPFPGPDWSWNRDLERPTINPSVLVQGGSQNGRCHSYVTDGKIQFLTDCTHTLAGKTVELPDWPYS